MKEKKQKDKTRKELKADAFEKKSERTGNEAWLVSRKRVLFRVFILILSGVMYSTAFPPFKLSFIPWVALIPLYIIASKRTCRQAFFDGLIWGYAWSVTSFFWMREIEVFLPFVMGLILGLFPACWAMFLPLFTRNILIPLELQRQGTEADLESIKKAKYRFVREFILIIIVASLWCLLEWFRSWMPFSGLPWNFMGVSQWKNIPLIQICEYTGVYGVSFLIAYFNIAFVFAWFGIKNSLSNGKYRRPIPLIIGIIMLMLSIVIGFRSMLKYQNRAKSVDKEDNNTISLIAAVIQGDIPQCRLPKLDEAEMALNEYIKLSSLAVTNKPDLLIWSETAVPVPYFSGHSFGTVYRFELAKLQKESGIPLLFGTIDFGTEFEKYSSQEDIPGYNAIFLLNGKNKVIDRYYKQHLVPWGEYTPLGEYYPALKKYFGMGRDLSPGTRQTLFELKKGIRAGAQVCFEDVFPEISRDFVKRGANLLVVLSNDAWYPESSESEQHMANSIFRAIENRRPMIRAGNNNGSCLILPNGVIADSVSLRRSDSDEFILAPEVSSRGYAYFKVAISPDPPLTFYTKYGNVFILFCGIIVLFASIHSLWLWRRRKEGQLSAFENENK